MGLDGHPAPSGRPCRCGIGDRAGAGADPVAFVAKTIKGKTIKKGSVPGDRLKKNSLTGKQIRESKLGTVPRAKAAATAKLADSAKTA